LIAHLARSIAAAMNGAAVFLRLAVIAGLDPAIHHSNNHFL
jgi:hypothetical protein